MIICSKCNIQFENGCKGSHHNHCPKCHKKHTSEYYKQNADKIKNRSLEYRLKNKDKLKQYSKKYRETHKDYRIRYNKKNKDRYRNNKLKTRYNLTLEEYNQLLSSQNGVCAICKQPETQKHQSKKTCYLSVDHNHTTGMVRGLLCHKCNKAIGLLNENLENLQEIIQYLKKGV